jgi:hypothetical protein
MKTLILLALSLSLSLGAQTVDSQIKDSQQILKKWLLLQKQGTKSRDLFSGQAERSSLITEGIPAFMKVINPQGVVFRHYIGSNMPIILESSQLKTGITPYVIVSPGYSKEIFETLVGIFLTTPQTPPEKVGLMRNPNADYIDFTLFPGTPVVQLEKEILLIPGRADIVGWMKKPYAEYLRTGRAEAQYIDSFKRFDESGAGNPTFMKVRIQSYRMNGKVIQVGRR